MKRRLLATATLTPVGVFGVAGVALAFWTASSSDAVGAAAADVLGAPSVSTSHVTASNVRVNVTGAPLSGPTPTAYRVDRTAPLPAVVGVCSISGATGSCDDTDPVQGSSNSYSVFAQIGATWTAATPATTSVLVAGTDATPPVTVAAVAPPANGAGWSKADVTVSLSATDELGGSGVKDLTYSATGAQTIGTTTVSGSSADVTLTVEGVTTLTFAATDNANNTESPQSVVVQLDKTGPINVLSLTSATGNPSFLRSGSVYYQAASAGSFAVSNALTDSGSGVASSSSALTGTSTGWTHTASTVSTPTGGPFVSNSYNWAAGTSTAPSASITGRDVADNMTSASLSLVPDVTGPAGGNISYANVTTTNTFAVIGFAAGTDAGAGLDAASARLRRSMAATTAGVCGTFGAFSDLAVAPTSSYVDSGLANGCYRYEYLVKDALGNATTYSNANTVVVDTTVPTVTVNQKSGQADPTNTALLLWTVTFSESVTGFDATDLTRGGAANGGTPTVTGSGASYEIELSPTTSGTSTFSIAAQSALDAAGNGNAQSTSSDATITYDVSIPVVSVTTVNGVARTFPYSTNQSVTSIGGSCGVVTGDSASVSPLVAGAATVPATATCTAGSWSLTLTAPLSTEGSRALSATQTDAAGNTGTATSQTVTIDKTLPVVSVTTVNGVARTFPYSTNQNLTSIGGSCGVVTGDSASVSPLVAGAATLPATATCTAGSWSLTLTTPLSTEGLRALSAAQTDAAGNTGTATSQTVTIDKTLPVVSVTTVNGVARTFPYSTNQNVTSIGGSCGVVTGDSASVSPLVAGAATVPATATCTAGSWSLTLTTPLSTEGLRALSATQTDAAGNTGTATSRTVTIDKTVPTATVGTITGGSNNGNGTINGSSSEASTVAYTVCTGTSTSCASSVASGTVSSAATSPFTWAIGYNLAKDTQYTVTVRPTDTAGNLGSPVSKTWNSGTAST